MDNFDKKFKKQIQEDTKIPENINQLFSNFESEVNMKEKLKKEEFKINLKSKIAAIIASLSIISVGGVAFACVVSEDVRTTIKSFFGIVSIEQYEEAKIDTNETIANNGYSLTLENYGIDAETLLLSFNLKTENEIELEYPFLEEPDYYFCDMVKIVNKNQEEYIISNEIIGEEDNKKSTILLDKINNKEYKIYEIYTIDSSKITEDSILYIDFSLENLPENATELVYNKLCEFNFEVPINSEKINNNFKEYLPNNAVITWDSDCSPSDEVSTEEIGQVTAELTKIKNSNILTKLTLQLDGYYHTNTQYTLKIVDENNNIILDRDIEYIIPGVDQDIIIPRIEMNSKIKIIFYEEEYIYNENDETVTKNDIVNATMTVDLIDIAK